MNKLGDSLRQLVTTTEPLAIAGVIHAYSAKLAEIAGFKAIYLSGAGVANAHFALPDLAMTSLPDVVDLVIKITAVSSLPLIVDADTGWGSVLNIKRTFYELSRHGAAAAHIEDQTEAKRCGHRDGKQLVSKQEMVNRIEAAIDGRCDPSFMVIARTDAVAVEGEQAAIDRVVAYQAAGADAIFVEALEQLEQYKNFTQALNIPVLANMTEFGKTPILTRSQLKQVGVQMVLYPLSAFRAMNLAAQKVYETILNEDSQQSCLPLMQTRDELYRTLDYEKFEQELDKYEKNH